MEILVLKVLNAKKTVFRVCGMCQDVFWAGAYTSGLLL